MPRGWTVVTGGVSTGRERGEGGVTYTEEGVGLRDLSIVVGRGLVSQETEVGGITIRVTGGRDARDQLEGIAKEAGDSLARFSDTFAPYPWRELDVLAVPLGSQVAGMEWPGMVWIESSLFGGGFPGLGDLEDLLEDLPGSESGASTFGDLEELFESLPGFADTRRFTVAHEVAHEWWHALVGNDSIASPVMDEPLAQYSACLDLRGGPSGSGGTPAPDLDPCVAHIDAQYQGMRSLGMEDAPAEQPTDAFASGLQYGGVIYGKAPGFYRALEQLIGPEAVAAGLREYATSYAFKEAGPDELLAAFAAQVPERRAEIDALWIRWMREAHGDEDLGTTSASGVPGPEGNGFEQLQELLERLFGEGGPGDIPDATEPTPTTQLA